MGLLDAMFGGGTKLTLALDAAKIPEGGMLSGTVSLSGGKKPLTLTALKVKLVYVKVTTKPDSPVPSIDLQILLDNTVVANQTLAPASMSKFPFTFVIPKGTDPSGTYQVIATADIPGVKDPSDTCNLKVLPAQERGFFGGAKGAEAMSGSDLLQQYPNLQSEDEEQVVDALREVLYASYDSDNNLLAAEPLLARYMRDGSNDVRAAALEAWGNILNNRARPEHIATLEAMAIDPRLTWDVTRQVIKATAKFAEEGAWDLLVRLAGHPDPKVREEVASQIYFEASKELKGRKDLLLRLCGDPEPSVRRSANRGLADFNDQLPIVQHLAQVAHSDPSPDVIEACVSAIVLAHHHGFKDLVFDVLSRQLQSPHGSVRREMAQSIHWLPADPRLSHIVATLLRDPSSDVRRAMAWQSCNMGDHAELRAEFMRSAVEDPDEEVRGDALGGLSSLLPLPEYVGFCQARLSADTGLSIHHGVLNGLRDHLEDPTARALVQSLQRSPHARIVERSREMLSG